MGLFLFIKMMLQMNVQQVAHLFFELEEKEGDLQPESEADSDVVDDDVADPSFALDTERGARS